MTYAKRTWIWIYISTSFQLLRIFPLQSRSFSKFEFYVWATRRNILQRMYDLCPQSNMLQSCFSVTYKLILCICKCTYRWITCAKSKSIHLLMYCDFNKTPQKQMWRALYCSKLLLLHRNILIKTLQFSAVSSRVWLCLMLHKKLQNMNWFYTIVRLIFSRASNVLGNQKPQLMNVQNRIMNWTMMITESFMKRNSWRMM